MYYSKKVPVDKRWKVLYGSETGLEARALEVLAEGFSSFITEYTLEMQIYPHGFSDSHIVLVGTVDSNPSLEPYMKDIELKPMGYYLHIGDNPDSQGHQIVVIMGSDPHGVLYGCLDFVNYYLPKIDYEYNQKPERFLKQILDSNLPYEDAHTLPSVDVVEFPRIKKRSLWTWGHVIHHYQGYLDNMMKLKMNQIIVWNDTRPINGRNFVEYAHNNGIEVIWGFSWAWGVEVDIADNTQLEKWKERVMREYEEIYKPMGGDGLYLQTFTETHDDSKDGKVIAEEAVRWVNEIGFELLDKYPDLQIYFGLHATSVKEKMSTIAKTDPRIDILWEDCGSFPYDYNPGDVTNFSQTVAFTDQMITLRGKGGLGIVVKGMPRLDWTTFEYKTGPFILGCTSASFRRRRTIQKRKYWQYMQSDWINNIEQCRIILAHLGEELCGETVVTGLVEDGMFDDYLWYPVALLAEVMWNYDRGISDIRTAAALRQDVCFG